MSKHLLLCAFGFLLAAAPAFGQPAPEVEPPAFPGQQQSVQSLVGLPVYSADNEKVGQVKSINIDANGMVTNLEAEIEGFLGLGTSSVRFTPDQFRHKDDRIVLIQTAGQVRGVPDPSYRSFDRSGGSAAP